MQNINPQVTQNIQNNKKHLKIIPLEHPITYIERNQLNVSLSKMQYTFSKADRFNKSLNNTSISPNKFYDLPTIRTQRSASFGYGKKIQLGNIKQKIPAPGSYNIPRDLQNLKNKGVSLGLSRQDIKFNNLFKQHLNSFAEPATYHIKTRNHSPSITIGLRFIEKRKWIDSVPGPGNYQHVQPTSHLKSSISQFKSSPAAKIPKTQRLKQILATYMTTPGPGNYQVNKTTIKKQGISIGKEKRNKKLEKSLNPGPGTYEAFSGFLH